MESQKEKTWLLISLTKRSEYVWRSWAECWVCLQLSVLSHGLIFHQCAVHISFTENVLYLKGYQMKGQKNSANLPILLSVCSPRALIYVPSVLFWKPHLRPCCSPETIRLLVTTLAWCISRDIAPLATVRLLQSKVTVIMLQRTSRSDEVMTGNLISSAFTCRHAGQHTRISPTFIWWTA